LTRPNSTRLYNAYIERDPVKIERASRLYEDQKEIESALRKAIRDNDPRLEEAALARLNGDRDTYYRLMMDVIDEGNFDKQIIKDAFDAEYNYQKRLAEENK
jgi:predicted component of type VI protein secretion system